MNLRPKRYWGSFKVSDDEPVVRVEPHFTDDMTDDEMMAWHQAQREYQATVADVDPDADPDVARAKAIFDSIAAWEPPRNGEVAWQPDGMGGMWIECEITKPESWRKQRRTGQMHISAEDLPEVLRAVRAAGIIARGQVEGAS